MADLISLDNGSKPPSEVIFDPLLQRSNNSNHINNVSQLQNIASNVAVVKTYKALRQRM